MTTDRSNLTPNQAKALNALLNTGTRKEAAKAANLDERTIRRYMEDANFMTEYRKACDALIDDATRQLKQMLPLGMDALEHLLTGETISDATRHAAVRTLFEYAVKYSELNDVEQRLDRIEQNLRIDTE